MRGDEVGVGVAVEVGDFRGQGGITVGGCWITGADEPFPTGGLRFGAYLGL